MSIYYQDNDVEIKIYSTEEIEQHKSTLQQEKERIKKEKYLKNIDYHRKNLRQQINRKLKTNPLFKLKHNIRNLIRNSIKGNGYSKTTKTYKILGCSFDIFKKHIESQFSEGMQWENYGHWEYDHITPISWATSEAEIIALNHYTNFRPLWREENQKKSNRYSA